MAKADTWIAVLLALIAGMVFYPFAALGVDPHHDGIMLKPALDVLSGQVLFRDTFSQYGPLTTYIQVLALSFSPALLSLRVLTVLSYAGSLFFLYLAWRALLPRSLSLVASLLFIISAAFYHPNWPMIPWSSTLALFFQSAAFLAFMRIVGGQARAGVWALALGVACACTLWCRLPVGLILTGSVGVIAFALHFTGWRHPASAPLRLWVLVALGFGAVTLLIIGHAAINGALSALWEQNVEWPQRWALQAGESTFWVFIRYFIYQSKALVLVAILLLTFAPSGVRTYYKYLPRWVDFVWWVALAGLYFTPVGQFVRPSLLLYQGGWSVLILMSIAVQAITVIARAIWPQKAPHSSEYYGVAILSGLSLGSAAQIYPIACANHIYWALAPGIGVFIYFCYRNMRLNSINCSLALVLLLTPAAYDKYRWGKYNLKATVASLDSPSVLSGMHVDSDMAAAIGRVQSIIQAITDQTPNQSVILYGEDAMYLTWFKNNENPSPYYVTWSGLLSPEEQLKRWNYLVTNRPVVFLGGLSAAELKVIPVDYELAIREPSLALRIMVPNRIGAHVSPISVGAMPALENEKN